MRRSNINIMARLIGLVAPLFPVAVVAIATGVMGFLCSIFITILGGYALLYTLGFHHGLELQTIILLLALCGGLRGVLRYIEQYCNHFIAFKILAIIRDKVFSALRRLAPAKLEGKDKGNLISIITSDVELLEVFYAHTISPVAIAFLISVIMVAFISQFHVGLGFIALCAYITVGIIVPTVTSKLGKETGDAYRGAFGQLNSYLLDSLRGLKETIQYKQGEKRLTKMNELAKVMSAKQKLLNGFEAMTGAVTNMVILLFSAMMFFGAVILYYQNAIGLDGVVLSTIAMMSSFGPVVALANLANNLLQTFASGNRVLDILDEQPAVAEVTDGYEPEFEEMVCDGIDFSYDEEMILSDFSMEIPKNNIIGITGKSGSGKSTLLKLMMRFWDVQRGMIDISNKNIKDIQTSTLRNMQSYVTQTTYLFQDTIENNLKLANLQATSEQIVEACKKASIHDFIMSLPNGYQSKIGELGDTLSGGEKQRLAVARAFLHDSSLILLDEPTSNLDSINEGILLKSLHEEQSGKTIVLVSHRKSTMKIADRTYSVENGRVS